MRYMLLFLAMAPFITCCLDSRRVGTRSDFGDPKENFILYVSNQSFDIADIDVEISIDNKQVFRDYLRVENQHEWKELRCSLSVGRHKIVAASQQGGIAFEKEFEITGYNWAILNFCTRSEGKRVPSYFDFEIRDRPIYFD